jgi:hypothetical protein
MRLASPETTFALTGFNTSVSSAEQRSAPEGEISEKTASNALGRCSC